MTLRYSVPRIVSINHLKLSCPIKHYLLGFVGAGHFVIGFGGDFKSNS
jgi:hypothetical protein